MDTSSHITPKRALVSVYNKTNIVDIVSFLHKLHVEIVATGNTAALLKEADIPVVDVADVTGYPDLLDGRVKTLHPAIHAGILANPLNKNHVQTLQKQHIKPFDIVIANLYPFSETLENPNASHDDIIEMIDIGGPTMIRAAAKNQRFVTVITQIDDYENLKNELSAHKSISLHFRQQMAQTAFAHTCLYDQSIHNWLSQKEPSPLPFQAQHVSELRYGENPHQNASLYSFDPNAPGPLNAKVLQAEKPLSYNNYIDANAAFNLAHTFQKPTVAIIKHTIPCGFCTHSDTLQALKLALASDPLSAFGGIIATNQTFSAPMAQSISDNFIEVIIAPNFESDALKILAKKTQLRLLASSIKNPSPSSSSFRHINGGFLIQDNNTSFPSRKHMNIMTQLIPSEDQWDDLVTACTLTAFAPSNTISIVHNGQLIGLGSGQTSRIKAAEIAIQQAKTFNPDLLPAAVAASDGFFPFFDTIKILAQAEISVVAHPGGSKNDQQIIQEANKHNISLIQHNIRSFSH
jgi:phosphoribosylaminoimidazolecarboxamide formyltransferase/IMP cyclohydrolase